MRDGKASTWPGSICPMTDAERTSRQYDAMARKYAVDNAESPTTPLQRPATIALLGDVREPSRARCWMRRRPTQLLDG